MSRILIIEDDEHIAELERDFLKLNGFEVEVDSDGRSGLHKGLTENFDLIIVDLMLPGVSGYEIIKSLRNSKEIPILVVSAKSEDIDKIRGLELGADDYLTKPFSPAELTARVRGHIRRYNRLRGADESNVISVQGLEIFGASHVVKLNGTEVSLTSKEYELLNYLASHPNQVFTKDFLFETLWGAEFGELATVAVHIQRLRKKIEKDPASPQLIETLWGSGYRFNV